MATTTDTDTELSAVNSILGAIGQSPITTLNYENPEVSFIYNILTEVNKDVQNEGWHFNTEYHVKTTPDSDGYISLPTNTLRYDLNGDYDYKAQDLVVRNGRLYDLVDHTDVFTGDLYLDLVTLYAFTDLPNSFQRYITHRASGRAAAQLVSNPALVRLLQLQEQQARATCMEYECNNGDHSFMGWPHQSTYGSYRPYTVLQR